jgi:hypothetical protein
MSASRLDGDFHVAGNLSANTITIPDGAISNAKVVASAGIAASKMQHQHRAGYGQPNSAATTETRSIAVVFGATGTLFDFRAGSIAKAVGDSTVTIDLKKNGASVLNTIITLDSANTNRLAEAATFSAASLAAGDWLEIVVTATIGTGTLPTGVFASLTWNEDYQ